MNTLASFKLDREDLKLIQKYKKEIKITSWIAISMSIFYLLLIIFKLPWFLLVIFIIPILIVFKLLYNAWILKREIIAIKLYHHCFNENYPSTRIKRRQGCLHIMDEITYRYGANKHNCIVVYFRDKDHVDIVGEKYLYIKNAQIKHIRRKIKWLSTVQKNLKRFRIRR